MSNTPQKAMNNHMIGFLIDDRYRLLRHISFLLVLLILVFQSEFSNSYPGHYKYYALFATYFILIVMFYINVYVLVPLFFFKGQYLLYLALLFIVVMADLAFITYILDTYLGAYRLLDKPKVVMKFERNVIAISVVLVTTTAKLLQRWTKDNERITELNNLTLRMELNELRNQINPHFLFNMLNSIKALIRIDPEKATVVIVKLSEFLRFQLYENNEEKTLLTSEMNFLSNFISLEKIRRDNLSVSIESDTDQRILNSIFVPPNLFTMFVENAVKHSVDITGKETYINIRIAVKNKQLHFICSNSVSPIYWVSDSKNSGLGLANIKRRLELLYQDKYRLDITTTANEYTVDLTIPV